MGLEETAEIKSFENRYIARGDSADYSKQEGSEGGAAVAGQQLWQASYSHELQTKSDDEEQKEYILLRIQNTTVTFLSRRPSTWKSSVQ